MTQLTTPDQLKAWLSTQPQQVCTAMAVRAALRVHRFDLQASRALITAAVWVANPSARITAIASQLAHTLSGQSNRPALLAIRCAADPDTAAFYATRITQLAPFYEALFDAQSVSPTAPASLFASPLWSIPTHAPNLPADFWGDWFQSFANGTPMDWDVQSQIALISDAHWHQGADHILHKIKSLPQLP